MTEVSWEGQITVFYCFVVAVKVIEASCKLAPESTAEQIDNLDDYESVVDDHSLSLQINH